MFSPKFEAAFGKSETLFIHPFAVLVHIELVGGSFLFDCHFVGVLFPGMLFLAEFELAFVFPVLSPGWKIGQTLKGQEVGGSVVS